MKYVLAFALGIMTALSFSGLPTLAAIAVWNVILGG